MVDLFAGKLHALLFRKWKNRIKGRDFYDFVWYIKNKTPERLKYLREKSVQSGHMSRSKRFDELQLKKLLIDRFRNIDIAAAKQDVLLFIKDADELRVWSSDFFIQITERLNPKVNPRPGFTAWLNRGNKFPK